MSIIQFVKDTRSELNHVAWPTRVQTLIFTFLVILLSALVALYLGLFDYLFTTGLGKAVELVPQAAPAQEQLQFDSMELAPLEGSAPAETPAETQ
jgi:preprotein translocase SecE subunit